MSDTPSPTHEGNARPDLDETPPILGSWGKIYIVSLVWFAVLVVLFFLLTRMYTS